MMMKRYELEDKAVDNAYEWWKTCYEARMTDTIAHGLAALAETFETYPEELIADFTERYEAESAAVVPDTVESIIGQYESKSYARYLKSRGYRRRDICMYDAYALEKMASREVIKQAYEAGKADTENAVPGRWFSVKDLKPPEDKVLLVTVVSETSDGFVDADSQIAGHWRCFNYSQPEHPRVTHWTWLPKPAKEERSDVG